jgi:hypothetical protein
MVKTYISSGMRVYLKNLRIIWSFWYDSKKYLAQSFVIDHHVLPHIFQNSVIFFSAEAKHGSQTTAKIQFSASFPYNNVEIRVKVSLLYKKADDL